MQQGDYEGAGNAPGVLPGQQKQTPSTSVRRINLTVFGVLCVFAFLYYVDVFLVVRREGSREGQWQHNELPSKQHGQARQMGEDSGGGMCTAGPAAPPQHPRPCHS